MTRALPSGPALFISVRPSRRPSHKKKNHRHNRQHQPFQTAKARQKASQAFRPDRRFLSLSAQANIQAIKKEPPAVLFHYINFRKATWQKCIFSELFTSRQTMDFLLWQPTQSINFIKTTVIVRLSASANIPKTWKTCSFVKLHTPRRFLRRANLVQTGQNTGRNKKTENRSFKIIK